MGSNARHRERRKRAVIILLGCLFVLGGAWVVLSSALQGQKFLSGKFRNPTGTASELFSFEVAATPADRRHGLMFRTAENFPPDRGMIFVFPNDEDHTFFMKNTLIPLDMIFVDSQFSVVGVLPNIPIMNEISRRVGVPSRFVVELRAGSAQKNGIVVGSKLELDRPLPVVSR